MYDIQFYFLFFLLLPLFNTLILETFVNGLSGPFRVFYYVSKINNLKNTKRYIAGIKIAGRNINNLRYADDTTLMAESEEEVK